MATAVQGSSNEEPQINASKVEEKFERFSEKQARPLSKPWHRNALIAVAIAGLLIGGAALAMHLGYLPEPTSLMHHFTVSSSTLQIAVGGTGSLMLLGGGIAAGFAEKRRREFIKEQEVVKDDLIEEDTDKSTHVGSDTEENPPVFPSSKLGSDADSD